MFTNIMGKYVKNPVRSFRVEVTSTNKVMFFDNVDMRCGGLEGFNDVVHAAFQLPPIKKVNLTWFSQTDTFHIANDDEFYEMWDKGVVEDDGYVHLYMNITNKKVPLNDEYPSSSGVSNVKSYTTPVKVKRTSRMQSWTAASPVTFDPSMFVTPKKMTIYCKSPELIRRSPRLISKSIVAVSGCSGSMSGKKLFLNLEDDDEVMDGEISSESRQDDLDYVNIQLENNAEDVCHPIDDCRNPVSDTEEMGIEVYTTFMNNYFGGEKSFNFLHPQLYMKTAQPTTDKGIDAAVENNSKGKAIVDVQSDAYTNDNSSTSEYEGGEECNYSVQRDEEDGGHTSYWYNQFEQV
ncbi:hypothetical protein MKX01_021526 [Papaver californicum]|nr:hypothetical protein MKX01_021526 [Papaver californicum]